MNSVTGQVTFNHDQELLGEAVQQRVDCRADGATVSGHQNEVGHRRDDAGVGLGPDLVQ